MKVRMGLMAVMMGAFPVFAQAGADPVVQEPDRVVVAKNSVVDFTVVDVVGDLVGPQAGLTKATKRAGFRSLIELRAHFKPEMKRSASVL
jgi:hypothetical protein